MVAKGGEHSAAPSSEGGGMGTSIPVDSLRRALFSSQHTPLAASSSTPVRGGRGKKRGSRGGRGGRDKGRVSATPSSPPPQLIHPSTGLLGWTCLRTRLRGLRSTSLGSTSLRPTRLLSQRLRPTRLWSRVGMRARPGRPHGIPGRRSLVAMLMVAGIIFLIATRSCLRAPPSTSMV